VEQARSAAAMLGLAGFVVLAVLDYARTISTSTTAAKASSAANPPNHDAQLASPQRATT